tara:strand:- start:30835 stop:31560 length:726 start_codon:yes stop_codon:yes gene_type:complete
MKNKILLSIIALLILSVGILWIQKSRAKNQVFQTQQELRKKTIAQDSLVELSDGYYQKLVADTLTAKQLKKVTSELVELKRRKPISVTSVVAAPKSIKKDVDKVVVEKDSIFVEDYYPDKLKPFLKYTNRISVKTEKGKSEFKFNKIKLTQVVTKKENGLYQVDFVAPEFLDVSSIDIQAEPMKEKEKDNWGTVIGVEYGRNLDSNRDVFGVNLYKRYKRISIGAGIDSDKTVKGGVRIEL